MLWSEKSNDINNNLILYLSTFVSMWFEFAFSTLRDESQRVTTRSCRIQTMYGFQKAFPHASK